MERVSTYYVQFTYGFTVEDAESRERAVAEARERCEELLAHEGAGEPSLVKGEEDG